MKSFLKKMTLKVYGMGADRERAQPVWGHGWGARGCAGKGGSLEPGTKLRLRSESLA